MAHLHVHFYFIAFDEKHCVEKCVLILTRYYYCSVTRLGDLLHFGQLFKDCGNNYYAQMANIYRKFL